MHTIKIAAAAIILTLLIITTGIIASHNLSKSSDKIESYISGIETNIKSSNWKKADSDLSNMKKEWKKIGTGWSILIDHIEIDNIDNSISRLSSFIRSKDSTEILAESSNLRQYIKHIPEKESFNLKNIL